MLVLKILPSEHFPKEQTDPHPKLWRFLVEIPESVRGSHQYRAISVARKAAGMEIMNNPNFEPRASWAMANFNFIVIVRANSPKIGLQVLHEFSGSYESFLQIQALDCFCEFEPIAVSKAISDRVTNA
jgi:hypothetical protein